MTNLAVGGNIGCDNTSMGALEIEMGQFFEEIYHAVGLRSAL
jgi:hypothetical protein